MFRSLSLFCTAVLCFAALSFVTVFAQDEPAEPIKSTPEMLTLLNESLQSLDQADPNDQAVGHFNLIHFALLLEDKAPARKAAENLLNILQKLESNEASLQFYNELSYVFCQLGDHAAAVAVLNNIPDAERYLAQQNLAINILMEQENAFAEQKEADHKDDTPFKLFDTSALLLQSIAGALAAQDPNNEAISRTFLGRELARQGKKDESAAAFAEAAATAQKLDDAVEKGHIFGMILKSQIWYDQVAGAWTLMKTITEPETQLIAAHSFTEALIYHEKYDDAEKILQTLMADQVKDELLVNIVFDQAETISDEKIGTFASQLSSDEQRNSFLQNVVTQLFMVNRDNAAKQVALRFSDPAEGKTALLLGEVRRLADKKQFADAVQFIDNSKESDELRTIMKREILVMQYGESPSETLVQQIAETFSSEEKITATELNETAKQVVESQDTPAKMDFLLEVLQEQTQLFDISGRRQTLKLILDQLDKESDLVRLIEWRLLFARIQIAFQEKEGSKENLQKLSQKLSSIQDINELKGLVLLPQNTEEMTTETVTKSAIRNELFRVYVLLTDLWKEAGETEESKSALEKAKELAKTETDAASKAEKLLLLAQLLGNRVLPDGSGIR